MPPLSHCARVRVLLVVVSAAIHLRPSPPPPSGLSFALAPVVLEHLNKLGQGVEVDVDFVFILPNSQDIAAAVLRDLQCRLEQPSY